MTMQARERTQSMLLMLTGVIVSLMSILIYGDAPAAALAIAAGVAIASGATLIWLVVATRTVRKEMSFESSNEQIKLLRDEIQRLQSQTEKLQSQFTGEQIKLLRDEIQRLHSQTETLQRDFARTIEIPGENDPDEDEAQDRS